MAEPATSTAPRPPASKWVSIAATVFAGCAIAALGYFGLTFLRDSSYQDARAFRVLGQVVDQFGNLQGAFLNAVQRVSGKNDKEIRARARRIALKNVRTDLSSGSNCDDNGSAVGILSIESEGSARRVKATGPACKVTLSANFNEQLPLFFAQEYFDSAIIATRDGDVLATMPPQFDESQRVRLHNVTEADLLGGNVMALLRKPADKPAQGDSKKDPGKKDDAAPAETPAPFASAHSQEIGGRMFRVYVLPFKPNTPVRFSGKHETALYAIGLRRQDVMGSISGSLATGGAIFGTLGSLWFVLSWPMLSLRFASRRESIARTQLIPLLITSLLLPAVIASTGFSLWSQHRLTLWADQHAEFYAQRVERVLTDELRADTDLLDSLAAAYMGKNFDEKKFGQPVKTYECARETARYAYPGLAFAASLPHYWSPLRSGAALRLDGTNAGASVGFYSATCSDAEFNLTDREYFQAIRDGDEWRPAEFWGGVKTRAYVAQRLFNRTDAARVLQLAMPMIYQGERIGVITGDSRVYGLTADLRVPLLRFAIVDNRNGSMLFNSDDRLSLAENLLVEAEGSADIANALMKRASLRNPNRVQVDDHFDARYRGAQHRFFHRAVPGAPWSLFVFYPTDRINSIVFETMIAALATYFSVACFTILALLLIVLALPDRGDIALLKWVWPKWMMHDRYKVVGTALTFATLSIAAIGLARLARWLVISESWAWTLAIGVVLATGVVAVLAQRRATLQGKKPLERRPGVSAFKRRYLCCMFCVLCLVAVLPVIGLSVIFQDTSVRAFVRDELRDAGADAERRQLRIQTDMRRFTNNKPPAEFSAQDLSHTLRVPGYRYLRYSDRERWQLTDVEPAPWLSRCGPPRLGWLLRTIWTVSTDRNARRGGVSSEDRDEECNADPVNARLRGEDGVTSLVSMPLDDRESRRIELSRDRELEVRYQFSSMTTLALISLSGALLLLLLCAGFARRLFGIRMPFAGRFTPAERDPKITSQLLDVELQLIGVKDGVGLRMTSKDEADWRAVHFAPVFREMWLALSTEEQMLLHKLAHGEYANPENQGVIELLLRRGYLKLAPWPRLVEPGFAEFIRTVQPDEQLDRMQYDTAHTTWSRIRTPLLVVLVIVAGLLMWLAGSTMQLLAATLAGMATLFGSITQVSNFLHREKSSVGNRG